MLVDGFHHRTQEHQELHVGVGLVLRIKQVDSGIGADRPVVVLARTVHPGERLLVHQAHEAMARGGGTQDMHGEHLVIDRDIGVFEHRRDFVLTGGHFVVSGHRRNAKLHELAFDIIHVGQHAFGDGAEVVVVELMALGLSASNKVRPQSRRSSRSSTKRSSTKKYSCSLPRVVCTRLTPSSVPKIFRIRMAWALTASMERRSGVLRSRASPVGDKDGRDAERAATAAREDERGTGWCPAV